MSGIGEFFQKIFGTGVQPKDLSIVHVVSRTILILCYSLFLVKIAHRRFMSRKTRFDFVVAFVLGSVLARAINGSAPLLPTLVSGLVIVAIHWLVDFLATKSRRMERFLKGDSTLIVQTGRPDKRAMNAHHITEEDLLEDLRLSAETDNLEKIREARFERNGSISFVKEE